jgi:hypothetical protein
MRKIKSPNLAQLLMQLRFTPEVKRRAQLEAAERLYCLIDPQKQYPYDFVCFHIIGFQPKSNPEPEVIAGRDLLDDLQIFISKLSGRLALAAAEAGEKVHTIEELAGRFRVSTKTIDRWRKRFSYAEIVFEAGVAAWVPGLAVERFCTAQSVPRGQRGPLSPTDGQRAAAGAPAGPQPGLQVLVVAASDHQAGGGEARHRPGDAADSPAAAGEEKSG